MASGPYADHRRGTWAVQWFDGKKWKRTVVVRKKRGWKPGDPMPKKPPPEAIAALGDYALKEQAARANKSPAMAQTIAEFLATYRESYPNSHEPNSVIELDKIIKIFTEWCTSQGIRLIPDLTTSVCYQWIVARSSTIAVVTGRPIQYATIDKERALLAAAWAQASLRNEIPENPWKGAKIPGKPIKKKRGSWTPGEFKQLLDVSKPWLRDVLILGCHTGLRIEALMGLEWRDIEWAKDKASGDGKFGYVIVRPELDKIGRGYSVPISEECHDMLARRFLHRDTHAVFVLSRFSGDPLEKSSTTDDAIRAACKRAKLKDPDSPNHHMRRSFGRWAVLGHLTGEPIPMYVVSRWLGHTRITTTQHYLDLNEEDSSRFMMKKGDARSGIADTPPPSAGDVMGGE